MRRMGAVCIHDGQRLKPGSALIHRLWLTELIENSAVFSCISEGRQKAKLATTHTQSAQERGANRHLRTLGLAARSALCPVEQRRPPPEDSTF